MTENNFDNRLQRSRPAIPIDPVFVAKTMEHIEQTRQPRSLLQSFKWQFVGGLTVALLLAVGTVIATHTNRADNQNQLADRPAKAQQQTPKSQTPQSQGTAQNPSTGTGSPDTNTQLASSLQNDTSSIDSQYSSLSASDYSDTTLSDSSLYN